MKPIQHVALGSTINTAEKHEPVSSLSAHSRCYGRTAALKAYCAILSGRWIWRAFLLLHFNGALVEWNWQGKTEVLGEKPVPVPLCPPQIPHKLTWDRTRASAVRGQRLTAWAMARPFSFLLGMGGGWIYATNYYHFVMVLYPDNPAISIEGREELGYQIHFCFTLSLQYTTACAKFHRIVRIFKLPVFLNGHYKNLITH
jgi:hypothetical protein